MTYYRTTAPSGEFVSLVNDEWVGQSLRLYGEWSYGEIEVLAQLLERDATVIEVGANIGSHTVFIARDLCPAGKVVAYEPRRILFQLLCANLVLNGITNVDAVPSAIGSSAASFREAHLPLHAGGNAGGHAIGELAGDDEAFSMVTLDSQSLHWGKVALIKIDVEGNELDVLKGAEKLIARDGPLIYLENDRPDKLRELLDHVASLEYEMHWHWPRLYRPDNFGKNPQNIFGETGSLNVLCVPAERKFKVEGMRRVTDTAFHPLVEGRV